MARSLRHLTRRRLTAAETEKALFQFQDMDDRACAIIVGAMLDHALERLLLSKMRELPKENRERLFFGTGPLGSFAGKIQVASAFNVIQPDTGEDLDIIRDIRNVFGHASHHVTFRNRSIRNRLRQLHATGVVDTMLNAFPAMRRFDSARGRFLLAGTGYVKVLDDMRNKARSKR